MPMIALIWRKELAEVLRDKKTLWFVVLLPTVILPMLMGALMFMGTKYVGQTHERVMRFHVEAQPDLRKTIVERLQQNDKMQSAGLRSGLETDLLKSAVQQQQLDFVLLVPETFDPDRTEPSEWQFYFKQSRDVGQFKRVEEALEPLFDRWREAHQARFGLSADEAHVLHYPVHLERQGTEGTREDVGEKAGGLIPYMLIFFCFFGAMLPAMDIGAGEKERGTLETLLMAPVSSEYLVTAKFLVILSCSMLMVILTLLSGALWSLILGQFFALDAMLEAISAIGLLDLSLLCLMLLPLAGVFGAALLAVSIYARSYKEAQMYMTPMYFIVLLPAMVAMLPGVNLNWGVAWAPLVNTTLASKELLKGTTEYAMLVPVFISNFLLGWALLGFCRYWCAREAVLFR